MNHHRWKILCLVAVILFIAIRWLAVSHDLASLDEDPDAYRALAEGLSSSGIFGRIGSDSTVHATAYRPPGYVWCLSWFVTQGRLRNEYVQLFHLLLGASTCLLTARIAFLILSNGRHPSRLPEIPTSSISGNVFLALLAGLGIAVDPILLKQSSQVMTETLATFLVVVIWWGWCEYFTLLLSRRRQPAGTTKDTFIFFLFGLVLGIACLVRPTSLAWVGLWIIAGMLLVVRCKWISAIEPLEKPEASPFGSDENVPIRWGNREPSLRAWTSMVVGVVIVLLPWAFRNHQQLGQWIMTTTHGGYTLLLANNPVLYANIEKHPFDRNWDENKFHQLWDRRRQQDPREIGFWQYQEKLESIRSVEQKLGTFDDLSKLHPEVADDRLAASTAWVTIYRSPVTFLKSCVTRFTWLWGVTPYRSGTNGLAVGLIGLWYSVLYVLGLLSIGGLLRSCFNADSNVTNTNDIDPQDGRLRHGVKRMMWLPAIALVISLTVVHTFYWSNMRMRAPAMPVLYVMATLAYNAFGRGSYLSKKSFNA